MMRFLWIAVLLISVGCHPAQTQLADFPAQRERMVKEQIVMRGVSEERVLAAMRKVPREEFVPEEFRGRKLRGSTVADWSRSDNLATVHRRVHDGGTAFRSSKSPWPEHATPNAGDVRYRSSARV